MLVSIYDEFRVWGPESSKKVGVFIRKHCILYCELAKQTALHHKPWDRYCLYPKHHLSMHCLEEQTDTYGNPCESWSYAGESAIGFYCDIAESIHPNTIHREVVRKRQAKQVSTSRCIVLF